MILFAANIVSREQTVALTSALQRAARAGGNPKLLIAVDQEGGQVKRLPSGPPTLSPPQMAATNKVSVASSQGRATGQFLKRWGINMDLAPGLRRADLRRRVHLAAGPRVLVQCRQDRQVRDARSRSASSPRGVAATAKHFPGLGSAPTDTDFRAPGAAPDRGPAAAPR